MVFGVSLLAILGIDGHSFYVPYCFFLQCGGCKMTFPMACCCVSVPILVLMEMVFIFTMFFFPTCVWRQPICSIFFCPVIYSGVPVYLSCCHLIFPRLAAISSRIADVLFYIFPRIWAPNGTMFFLFFSLFRLETVASAPTCESRSFHEYQMMMIAFIITLGEIM